MIITDGKHLISTDNEDELHRFARRMGLLRSWYQNHSKHPHYDLTTRKSLSRAIKLGAKVVSSIELIKSAWW